MMGIKESIIHENIGKEGIILEIRPKNRKNQRSDDMKYLKNGDVENLYNKLGNYLDNVNNE